VVEPLGLGKLEPPLDWKAEGLRRLEFTLNWKVESLGRRNLVYVFERVSKAAMQN
jgi:hypothetical protein